MSIQTIRCFFTSPLKIALHFFEVSVYCVVVYFLELEVLSKRHDFLALAEEVVLKSCRNVSPNLFILFQLFAGPLLARLIHPGLVFIQALP